jgi:hypothetical protein
MVSTFIKLGSAYVCKTAICDVTSNMTDGTERKHRTFLSSCTRVQILAKRLTSMTGLLRFSSVPPGECRDDALKYTTIASFHVVYNSVFIK